jgi:hypothetical protein
MAGPLLAQTKFAVTQADLKFSLEIPAEFEAGLVYEPWNTEKLVQSYKTKPRIGSGTLDPSNGLPWNSEDPCGIFIHRMGRLLYEGEAEVNDDFGSNLPRNVSAFQELWKGKMVPGRRMELNSFVYLSVVIPLTPQAIWVTVYGKPAREGDVRAWLMQIVRSVEGEEGYNTAEKSIVYYFLGGLALLFFAGLGAMYFFKKRQSHAAPDYSNAGSYGANQAVPQAALPPPRAGPAEGGSCKSCGTPLRPGRKKCMSCGADA